MAVFFEEEKATVSLPFVNDYCSEQKKFKSEVFFIRSIKPSKKGTGLLLYTDAFLVFLFKNSKPCKRVIEVCEQYQDEYYYPLICQTTNSDPFYILGLDDESTGLYMLKKDDFLNSKSWLVEEITPKSETSNPQSPPIPAQESVGKSSTGNSGPSTRPQSPKAS